MKYFSKIAIVSAVVACVLGVVAYVKANTAVIWVHDKDEE